MLTTIENDILFDDAAILEIRLGKDYLKTSAENLSPDCNCSGYTEIEEDLEIANYNDCNNNV